MACKLFGAGSSPADAYYKNSGCDCQKEDRGSFCGYLDDEGLVHMAHMDIHFTHSTNGVAALHTEILKNSEPQEFL